MKVVSLMAGVGITDMCFTQQGAQIIVASDMDRLSMEVYQYNHNYADPQKNPTCVIGDITHKHIQNEIINAAQIKLNPDEPLDLLTLFLPPAKNLKELLGAVKYIAENLNAKLIYIDALSYNRYYLAHISNIVESMMLQEKYYGFAANHDLNTLGVPNKSKRQAVFFLNKEHFSEDHYYLTRHRAQKMAAQEAPLIKDLFAPIPLLKKQNFVPLQEPTVLLKPSQYDELFYQTLSQLRPGESLFLKNGNTHSLKRYKNKFRGLKTDENAIFPLTLSERAKGDWEWAIHPKENRGFTPLELYFLATLHLIPFELAPESAQSPLTEASIITRITNATAPAYLIRVLSEVLFPILGHENTKFLQHAFPNRYSRAIIEEKTYYLGSTYAFKPRQTNSHTLLFEEVKTQDKKNADQLFEHRVQHMQNLKRGISEFRIKNPNPNAYSDAIIDFILTLKKPFKVVRCNDVHYRHCMKKESKLCDTLSSILSQSSQIPAEYIEELKNFFINEFVLNVRKAKAQSIPAIADYAFELVDSFIMELNKKYSAISYFQFQEQNAILALMELSAPLLPQITYPELLPNNALNSPFNFFKAQPMHENELTGNSPLPEVQTTSKKRKKDDGNTGGRPLKQTQLSMNQFFTQLPQSEKLQEDHANPIFNFPT